MAPWSKPLKRGAAVGTAVGAGIAILMAPLATAGTTAVGVAVTQAAGLAAGPLATGVAGALIGGIVGVVAGVTVLNAYPEAKAEDNLKMAYMVKRLKEKLYYQTGIKEHVQEVYEDLGTIFVSVDHGQKLVVQQFVREAFGDMKITYVEQKGLASSGFLDRNDASKFAKKSAIGPGSCIVKVKEQFAKDTAIPKNGITVGDIIVSGNMAKSTGPCSVDGEPGPGGATAAEQASEECTFGTLGCFAQVHSGNDIKLYGLSVRHVLGNIQDDVMSETDDAFVVTVIEVASNVDVSIQSITNESYDIDFQKPICFSDHFVGVLNEETSKTVDVALLGPVHQHLQDTHKTFAAKEEQEIQVFSTPSEDYAKRHVKKMGAVTRLTKGKVLSHINNRGLFVVATKTDNLFADKGDSGAVVLLDDDEPSLVGMGLIYKQCPEYERGGEIYKDVVLCVRLDYCIDALHEKLKLDQNQDKIVLFYGHIMPNVELYLKGT